MIINLIFLISLFLIVMGVMAVFNIRMLTYLTIISIFFPIYIPFMGRDALTTGTVFIFLLYCKYVIESFKQRRLLMEKFDIWVYLLIAFGGISTICAVWNGLLGKDQIGPAVRQYLIFFSALLLFLVIKNDLHENSPNETVAYNVHIQSLITLFLVLTSIHVLVSIGVKFFPAFGSYFKIFLSRDKDVLDIFGRGQLERIGSFVFSYEHFGEILALLSPLVLYKLYYSRKLIWIIFFWIFCFGQIFAVTRSGIILFVMGVSIFLMFHFREKVGKTLLLMFISVMSFCVVLYLNPAILSDVFFRFGDASDSYQSTRNIFNTINRDYMPDILHDVLSNLTLLGHGIFRVDYHNLYLTTLQQLGVIGSSIFFLVLIYPAVRLYKTIRNSALEHKALVFSCLLAMILFFINETKFEFTRQSSYQQICWGLFATFYLVSKSPLQKKEYTV